MTRASAHASIGAMTSGGEDQAYEIVVRGEIGDHFAVLFDELQLERRRGTTVLTGPIRDQSQLHGVIERIQELGLELVSVNQLDRRRKDGQ
jgi:hypothetical protein